jgi:cytochrome oxidase Cu insertion factor (SCO1/SenC/PrrC family)
MLIFFIIPIIAVIAMYKLDWRPKGESVGELVSPPRTLSISQALINSNGTKVSTSLLKDKWSMVYVTTDCDLQCKNKLHQMRQLHVSLYKEIPRMQRVLITTTPDVADIARNYPELLIINQPADDVIAFSQQFNIDNETAINANRIYLSDPLGQLIISYHASTSPALVRKDITRLMKYSWTG